MNQLKLAIIGASKGQLSLLETAKQMGIYTICFSYEQNAPYKDKSCKFYPISILEKEKILQICKKECIDGVVSNGSDLTASVVSFISDALKLHGNNYSNFIKISQKEYIRKCTNKIAELSKVKYFIYSNNDIIEYPCVIKPTVGGGKRGVSFVKDKESFLSAIEYAKNQNSTEILIEQYIEGDEVSVESISYEGNHYVLQITDKDSSGPPHFVELGHHQPSKLPSFIQDKIIKIVPKILCSIGYENGASHIELKIKNDNIYLIKVNLRGGGDEISNQLVKLSTGYDYIKGMIEVALGIFSVPVIKSNTYGGIYFLCNQNKDLLNAFKHTQKKKFIIDKKIDSLDLIDSVSNYDRNGYLIYKSDHRVSKEEIKK